MNTVEDEFKCFQCNKMLSVPQVFIISYSSSIDKERYCYNCISLSEKYSKYKCSYSEDRYLMNIMTNLCKSGVLPRFKCPNEGCDETFDDQFEMIKHFRDNECICKYQKVICPYCNNPFFKINRDSHFKNCEKYKEDMQKMSEYVDISDVCDDDE
jgi:hypothetical protein